MSALAFLSEEPSWAAGLAPALLRCALGGIVLIAFAWAVAFRIRERSAALRHRTLALGLAGAAALPLLVPFTHKFHPNVEFVLDASDPEALR